MRIEPLSTSSPATDPIDADMVWYRRGREYVTLMILAAEAFAAKDLSGGSGKEEAADHALWQLDSVEANQLREFVAGVHREAQTRLREVSPDGWGRRANNAGAGTATRAALAAASSAADAGNAEPEGTESLYGPVIVVHRALVDMALRDLADPGKRVSAFGYLGVGDHENRVLKARSLDEGTGYDTLVGVHDDIASAVDQASADELRAFVRGTAFAHLSDLG